MLPKVIVHTAISLDGATTGFPVDLALFYGIASRWNEDATLVGSETILAATPPDWQTMAPPRMADTEPPDQGADQSTPDEPTTNARSAPLLVVPDSKGRIESWPYWLSMPHWGRAVALCSESTPAEYLELLDGLGIDHVTTGAEQVDLHAALSHLASDYGVASVRVDSGGRLSSALLAAELVSEISLLVHPLIVGAAARSHFVPRPVDVGSHSLRLEHSEALTGGIVWLRYLID